MDIKPRGLSPVSEEVCLPLSITMLCKSEWGSKALSLPWRSWELMWSELLPVFSPFMKYGLVSWM
jgi:hypothetical protein